MNFLVWVLLVLATAVAVESVTWSQDELDIVGEKLRYSMGSKRGKVLKELETKHKWVQHWVGYISLGYISRIYIQMLDI